MNNGETLPIPSFNDLVDNAEASLVKRAVARFLIPRNSEKSIKRHERFGTPFARKLILKITPDTGRKPDNNYGLNELRPKLDRVVNYALGWSVFNELLHGAGCIAVSTLWIGDMPTTNPATLTSVAITALGALPVAVQRYNRARIASCADKLLEHGEVFSPRYENWLGIDHRALENYNSTQQLSEPSFDQKTSRLAGLIIKN